MSSAQRFTTEYVDFEDRVRLTYLIQDGSIHIAWLTHRFLDRLITHAVNWLEKSTRPMPRGDTLQAFALDVAVSKLPEQPPVKADADAETPSWVVYSVDFKFKDATILLALKSRDEASRAELSMNIVQLRQWLNILHKQYVKAGWNLSCWPEWLLERDSVSSSSPKMLH